MKIKKNDTVLIITGKCKNKKGKVIKAIPKSNKIVIEGLNIVKRHMKPRKSGEKGQIIEVPSPINLSNVKLVCPKCGQATRIGYRVAEKEKFRVCKKCNSEV